jgi:hypothetical protein
VTTALKPSEPSKVLKMYDSVPEKIPSTNVTWSPVLTRPCRVYEVSESNGYGVREYRLWCKRVTVAVSESIGYGVTCRVSRMGRPAPTVVSYMKWPGPAALTCVKSNGYGVAEKRLLRNFSKNTNPKKM